MLAANSTPLPQACGARRTPCAVGAKPAAGRLHPAHTVSDREPVAADHAHLGGGEALGRIAREFLLGLVARRPAAAGIASHRAAHRTKRLVEWNAERLRLRV